MNKILASPAAKRIAKERNINMHLISTDNPNGYIHVKDVLSTRTDTFRATPLAKKMISYHNLPLDVFAGSNQKIYKSDVLAQLNQTNDNASNANEKIIPLEGMRKVISENMMNSLLTQAQTTVFAELDVTELVSLHKQLKETYMDKYGVKLTITHLMTKLMAIVLQKNPMINTALIDNHIHIYDDIHIGIATALDNGLIVPVIKNCQQLSLVDIAKESNELITKARAGKLKPSEYTGGTFSISNLGNVAVDFFNPILNSPQTGIIGIGRTVKKPVVIEDEIKVRSMTHFNLTYDHRVIDGMVAAQFMNDINAILKSPLELII